MTDVTAKSRTAPAVRLTELARVRKVGFAIEEGEMELGVTCVAVAIPSHTALMSISMSAPAARMTSDIRKRAIPFLQEVAAQLGRDLDSATA